MTYWLAIAALVAGQCADLFADYRGIRRKPTKEWQQAILRAGLLKLATWVPVASAVWAMGTAGALVAGAQGAAFCIWKLWQQRTPAK